MEPMTLAFDASTNSMNNFRKCKYKIKTDKICYVFIIYLKTNETFSREQLTNHRQADVHSTQVTVQASEDSDIQSADTSPHLKHVEQEVVACDMVSCSSYDLQYLYKKTVNEITNQCINIKKRKCNFCQCRLNNFGLFLHA